MEYSGSIRLVAAFLPAWIALTTPSLPQEPGGHFGTGEPGAFVCRRFATATRTVVRKLPQGATAETETAVLEGLRWLARHQNDDGSWSAAFTSHCTGGQPCGSSSPQVDSTFDEGLTGLALLAFLGQGISLRSTVEITDTFSGERLSAGAIVESGIDWLVRRQREDGGFGDPDAGLYGDILPTMALCEAFGVSRESELRAAAQRAVDHLVSVQGLDPQGSPRGWSTSSRKRDAEPGAAGVTPTEHVEPDADIAVTAWAVLALWTARQAGLSVPDASLAGALACARDEEHRGYGAPLRSGGERAPEVLSDHPGTLSALGMLVRTFVAHDRDDPFLASAAKTLKPPAVSRDGSSIDLHYWHCATLALWQFDGPDTSRPGAGKLWESWNKALIRALLPLQSRPERGACKSGGWLPDARGSTANGHALYCTALSVLTLEAYYRYESEFR